MVMKKLMQTPTVKGLAGAVLCAVLFSFAPMPGAHNFQVYLDDKMVIDQYAHLAKEAAVLSVDPQSDAKEITVRYNECGRTVSGRHIILKDENGKLVKDWSFPGSSTGLENPMSIKVKDVVALKQNGNKLLKLYYTSDQFTAGQQVVAIKFGKDVKTVSR